MKYLFWDIDGTLLLTGGAGANAMLDVIKEHYFLKDFKFQKSLAGRTDSEIIKEAVLQIKGHFHAADAASLLIRYHMALPKYLNCYQGYVLPHVQKLWIIFPILTVSLPTACLQVIPKRPPSSSSLTINWTSTLILTAAFLAN